MANEIKRERVEREIERTKDQLISDITELQKRLEAELQKLQDGYHISDTIVHSLGFKIDQNAYLYERLLCINFMK